MQELTYSNLALDWTPQHKRDRFFNRLTFVMVLLALVIALVVMSINLPKEKRWVKKAIPERVAKFIMQKEKPKVIKKKPVPKPKPIAKVIKRIKTPSKSNKPLTKIQKKARKKAETSGLLALNNELSDLMDTSSVRDMVSKRVKSSKSARKAVSVNKDMLTANVTKGSGGVSKSKYATSISTTVLSQQEKLALRQSLSSSSASKLKGKSHITRGGNVRSEEDVIYVMDQNKSQLHSIYRRARRVDPGLKGKIILEITIAPSGKVIRVRVKSSELNNPKLEARLIARIKRFDFGSSQAEKVTVTFPIEFLPS